MTDTLGAVGTDWLVVQVANAAPLLPELPGRFVNAGQTLVFTTTFSDPGLQDTYSAGLDWGDGTVETLEVNQAAWLVSGTHVYGAAGAYTASLTLSDDGGAQVVRSFPVIVTPVVSLSSLTLSIGGSGSGAVTITPPGITCLSAQAPCSQTYNPGTLVTLTAAPQPGSVFAGWGGACAGVSANTCQVTVDQTLEITATFNSTENLYLPLIKR